jgi:hypothetical protein
MAEYLEPAQSLDAGEKHCMAGGLHGCHSLVIERATWSIKRLKHLKREKAQSNSIFCSFHRLFGLSERVHISQAMSEDALLGNRA